MAEQRFDFASPSIEVNEIDNSKLPRELQPIGPTFIGRASKGPALRPVEIKDEEQLFRVFGAPSPGLRGNDVWREGNFLAPTYGMYAAQAWLKSNSTINFVRLLGSSHTDNTSAGVAGWKIGSAPSTSTADGGAYGLFVIDSGSATSGFTGSLAAIWYLTEGSIELSGSDRDGNTNVTGTAVLIGSQGTDKEFKVLIKDSTGAVQDNVSFNFNENSRKYLREVFNTNPTLTNSRITNTGQLKTYFLGESFERSVNDTVTSSAAGAQWGVILALSSASAAQNIQEMDTRTGETGWFISQHLGNTGSYNAASETSVTRLFKVKGLEGAEWEAKNYKISISNVRAASNPDVDPYGTFDLLVRRTYDNDASLKVIEQFVNCNLNPASPNYLAKKVGDTYSTWDDAERRYRVYGNHPPRSSYIRVEMNSDVDAGAVNPSLLPFGVLGPVRFRSFAVVSGAAEAQDYASSHAGNNFAGVFAQGNADIVNSQAAAGYFMNVGNTDFTGSFLFPSIPLRTSSKVGNLAQGKEAFWGADSTKSNSSRLDPTYADLIRPLPSDITPDGDAASMEYQWIFSLDDLVADGTTDAVWTSGSRSSGTSITAVSGTYESVLNAGFNRFTSPLWNAFDGLDITEKDPFNNTVLSNGTETTSYEFNSIKRAIDSVRDEEVILTDLISVPGVTNTDLTDHVLHIAESRGDSLAIIDIEGGFIPSTENNNGDASAANRGSVSTTVTNAKARRINSSYGASYYPWVQIEDAGVSFWVPPSVVAAGAISNTQKVSELWFAPAGFNRGGLSNGSSGLTVLNVRQQLSKDDRDELYRVNINPIAKYPNEGIVIMGQKTLSAERMSTDRVNVRRLANYIKRRLAQFGKQVLFDPNIDVTWKRYLARAEPFMASVKSRFGIEQYKLILDSTTTTPDLVDRNIMYAKALIKPTKAIENIVIDFVITNNDSDFE